MTTAGRDALVRLDHEGRAASPLAQPCVSIAALCAHGDGLALIGSTPDAPSTVWLWSPDGEAPALASPAPPCPRARRTWRWGSPSRLTGRSGRPVHGTLFRPARATSEDPEGAPPPLVTWCHGGPTSSCQAGLDLTLQFFTTRGFAVACVDYAGSSGYGRAYRCALWGRWGVADSEDCLDAALLLAARGDVDPQRMAIRGGSAGRHDGAQRAGRRGGVRGLRVVVRGHRSARTGGDHPRLRGPLHRPPDRAAARSPARSTRSVHPCTGPAPCGARSCSCREPRTLWSRRHRPRACGTPWPRPGPPATWSSSRARVTGSAGPTRLTACLEAELAFYLRQLHL